MLDSQYKIPKAIELKTTKNEDLRKFCVMPLRAFLNPKISPYALRVLGVLASYCNRGGFSFVSMKTIAKDLGCTHQNIHKHLKNLEKFGIIETYSNYFPKLKGNTRRVIFDETIKREDLKEHDLHNSEITEILKTNKLLNEVNENDSQLHLVAQSENTERDDLASLFSTITKESQLIEAERLLSQGLTPGEVRIRMALGS